MCDENQVNFIMYFENMEFKKDEVNLTVRRGTKWDASKDIEGYAVGTRKEDGSRLIEVRETKVMRFEDIEKEDLTFEHDPRCRTYEGLLEVMREVYSDFDVYEIVTLVYFKLLD